MPTELGRSTELLPWPEAWSTSLSRDTASPVVALLLTLLALVSAASEWSRGHTLSSAFIALWVGVFAAATVLHLDGRARRRGCVRGMHSAPTHAGQPGTALPYSWPGFAAPVVMSALVAVFVALAGYLLGLDYLALPRLIIWYGSWLFAAFLASYAVQVLAGRFTRGWLILTPHGIEHRHAGYRSRLSWPQVQKVSVKPGLEWQIVVQAHPGQVRHEKRAWWCYRPALESGVVIQGRLLGVDPVLALRMLQFYACTPHARVELGTQDAVQRASTAMLPLTP